jgi:hypothetical protein
MLSVAIHDKTLNIQIDGEKITLNKVCYVAVYSKDFTTQFSVNTNTFLFPEGSKCEVCIHEPCDGILLANIKNK